MITRDGAAGARVRVLTVACLQPILVGYWWAGSTDQVVTA